MAGISSVVGKKNSCCWLDLGWRSADDFLENVRVKVYLNLKMYFSFKLKNEIIKTGVPRMRLANGFLCRDGGGSLGGAYLQHKSLTVNNWLHRWGRDLIG